MKPLLIHSVKATDLILQLNKEFKPKQPWIMHGFRGNKTHAEQLINAGIFISFGEKYNPEAVRICPSEKLFLETDESAINIKRLYSQIADLRNEPPLQFEKQITENIHKIFLKPGG